MMFAAIFSQISIHLFTTTGVCIIYAMTEHIDLNYVLMLVFMLIVIACFILLDILQLLFGRNSGSADGKNTKSTFSFCVSEMDFLQESVIFAGNYQKYF